MPLPAPSTPAICWMPKSLRSLLMLGGIGGRRRRGRQDEMAGWHHQLDGHEFEWTPGVGNGQGGLACCNSWARKELDTTERLNWTELNLQLWHFLHFFLPPFIIVVNWKIASFRESWFIFFPLKIASLVLWTIWGAVISDSPCPLSWTVSLIHWCSIWKFKCPVNQSLKKECSTLQVAKTCKEKAYIRYKWTRIKQDI